MSIRWPSSFFVSGTDTGIGKSLVSAILAQGLDASYWKPIQSGLLEQTDTEYVQENTDLSNARLLDETYRLTEPLSPHASAIIDEVTIHMEDFILPETESEHLVVEGAGGLMVPINDEHMIIDLIGFLDLPVLLVARSELGTLNHTFLSLEALRKRDIPILGVVMNGPANNSNRLAMEKYGRVEILAEIEPLEEINSSVLRSQFDKHFGS